MNNQAIYRTPGRASVGRWRQHSVSRGSCVDAKGAHDQHWWSPTKTWRLSRSYPRDLKVISLDRNASQGCLRDRSGSCWTRVLYPMFENEAILDAKLAPMGSGARTSRCYSGRDARCLDPCRRSGRRSRIRWTGYRVDVLLTGQSL